MQRFNAWLQKVSPDFWRDRFKPKDLLRVMSHTHSILSMRHDARLMERFDINDIAEHSVGKTYIWVPVEFGEPTYLGSQEVFPWEYDIDEDWLFVDAIYDKHVDPEYELQHNIDFQLIGGKIRFAEELPKIPLYIAKGRYAGYRIYDEIGVLLDYKRKDSVKYRDSIEPILAAFYQGPTPRNLIAVLCVVAGIPVAKYGDETVISTKDQTVETDRYTYPMGTMPISVKEGEVLYKHQPLSDAIEIMTHKTNPYWWESRPADMFSKYRVDGVMTVELRDYLLSNYLHDVVTYIKFNLEHHNLVEFSNNKDLLNLFFDALPTRADIFMSQQYTTSTVDPEGEVLTPDKEEQGVRVGVASVYGKTKINNEMFIYAPDLGRPVFTDNDNNAHALKLNDGTWHIFSPNETDNWREFWKGEPNRPSHVEPNFDSIYLRLSPIKPWDYHEMHLATYDMPDTISDMGVKIEMRGDSTGGFYSEIPQNIDDGGFTYQAIQGETICGILEMDRWEWYNLTMGRDGLVVFDDYQGYAITHAFPLGGIPKNVFIRPEYESPDGTLVDVKYSQDKINWEPVPNLLYNLTGYIYFKITLYASEQKSPTFRRLYVNLTANT